MIQPNKTITLTARQDICNYFPKDSKMVELGVFRGKLAYWLVRHPNVQKYTGVDGWWVLYGELFPWKSRLTKQGTLTTKAAYDNAVKCIAGFPNASFLVGESTEMLSTFADDSLDVVYIDSSHEYAQTLKELEISLKKVRSGGVICGHDINSKKHPGVTKAVHEFVEKNSDKVIFEWTDNCMQWLLTNIKKV